MHNLKLTRQADFCGGQVMYVIIKTNSDLDIISALSMLAIYSSKNRHLFTIFVQLQVLLFKSLLSIRVFPFPGWSQSTSHTPPCFKCHQLLFIDHPWNELFYPLYLHAGGQDKLSAVHHLKPDCPCAFSASH